MKTVAVLDDDHSLVELYQNILQDEGYRTLTINSFQNLSNLLNSIREGNPDLLILDMRLPGVNILDVIKGLQTGPNSSSPKILICSAAQRELEQLRQKLNILGYRVDGMLEKPFDLEDFVRRVGDLA